MRVPVRRPLSAPPVLVPAQRSGTLATQPQSGLWVEGPSTIRGFECRVAEFTLAVKTVDDAATIHFALATYDSARRRA